MDIQFSERLKKLPLDLFADLRRKIAATRERGVEVISHTKRTMSMANVLYGVTMQEPGVSKRISVKFEEVAEKVDEQLQPA